jgi:transcriptional regulator with PAS, ATPase and Fis domain
MNANSDGWALVLKPFARPHRPPEFLGSSSVTQELLEFVSRIALSRATSILLLGESGTGKDLIARRLHGLSPRAAAPFVPINCAALPESLCESELFGYEKGAFTSATQRKEGLFSFADGGTIFLDEIGELPMALQAKVLRVLEDRSFRPLGGTRSISVDVRVVSATNADLEKSIQSGRFRSDLYYRLSGVQIHLPSLRERAEDIRGLALYFLEHFNRVHRRHLRGIHPAAQRKLDSYAWPGNVRELRNVIERAVLMENDSWITPPNLAFYSQSPKSLKPGVAEREAASQAPFCLRGSERELVAAALAEAHGNQTRAARLLGIGRFSLRYKMKKLGYCDQ